MTDIEKFCLFGLPSIVTFLWFCLVMKNVYNHYIDTGEWFVHRVPDYLFEPIPDFFFAILNGLMMWTVITVYVVLWQKTPAIAIFVTFVCVVLGIFIYKAKLERKKQLFVEKLQE